MPEQDAGYFDPHDQAAPVDDPHENPYDKQAKAAAIEAEQKAGADTAESVESGDPAADDADPVEVGPDDPDHVEPAPDTVTF